MIENFEDITHELDDKEKEIIPILVKGIKGHDKDSPITEPKIRGVLKSRIKEDIGAARLRKLINLLRQGGFPVIATSKGYYYSMDPIEIKKQIKSLRDRASAINAAASGLEKIYEGRNSRPVQSTLDLQWVPKQ